MQNNDLHLKAPFPWYGGKTRWVEDVIEKFGDIGVYAEPFAGSLAVLLGSPKRQREIVCDTDGMICNAWRAIQHDPEMVAYWADYPTIHQDLTARRRYLSYWREINAESLSEDPFYFDSRAAGWWIWCISNWIGPSGDMLRLKNDSIPHVAMKPGGQGVQAQRKDIAFDKRPNIAIKPGGQGVQAQRINLGDQIPHINNKRGGQGVQAQRNDIAFDKQPHVNNKRGGQGVQAQRNDIIAMDFVGDGSRLSHWMVALSQRLSGVVVLNRDWTAALTPTPLQHTPTSPKPQVGVFLDPPYLLADRSNLYQDDTAQLNPARASYDWAVAHGDIYRVAYCCHDGDFEVPYGWIAITRTFKGIKMDVRRGRMDMIMFSPSCLDVTLPNVQLGLL